MPQVPFPTNIPDVQVVLKPRARMIVLDVVIGLACLSAVAAAGAVLVRTGVWDLVRGQSAPVEEQAVEVAGAVATSPLGQHLPQLVLWEADLPAALKAYRWSESESGATSGMFGSTKPAAAHKAVFATNSLTVFTSTTYLFASATAAAQAYVQETAAAKLSQLVGQSVELVQPVAAGAGGIVFQERGAATSQNPLRFGGAVVVNDQIVHVVFGLFPAAVSGNDLAALAGRVVDRYSEVGVITSNQVDLDKDGLSDALEDSLGTNIDSTDTDGDGYSDLVEVQNGFDPVGVGKLSGA